MRNLRDGYDNYHLPRDHALYDAMIMTGLLHFGKIEIINVDHKTPFIVNNMSLGIKQGFNFFLVNLLYFLFVMKMG